MTTSVAFRGFALFNRSSKPKISIGLTGLNQSPLSTFTTHDQIEGIVTITVEEETRFSDVDITLEGRVLIISNRPQNGTPV
jgi:hypothetical protein